MVQVRRKIAQNNLKKIIMQQISDQQKLLTKQKEYQDARDSGSHYKQSYKEL